jgi:hypothetical protein
MWEKIGKHFLNTKWRHFLGLPEEKDPLTQPQNLL